MDRLIIVSDALADLLNRSTEKIQLCKLLGAPALPLATVDSFQTLDSWSGDGKNYDQLVKDFLRLFDTN